MRISDWSSDVCSSDRASSNLIVEGGTLQYTGASATSDRGFTLVNGGGSRTIDVTHAATDLTFTGLVTSPDDARSDARRDGKGCVSTCRSRWSPSPSNKHNNTTQNKPTHTPR